VGYDFGAMGDPLPNGTLLADKFRIVRLLGSGGTGAVYEIVHEPTRHRRALKLVHPQSGEQDEVVERFLREASMAGRLRHPHIVETFDVGRLDGGEPYVMMELLDGVALTQRISETGGLSMLELTEVMSQACNGVQAAHDAGIVHGDLEPSNLLITSGGGRPFLKILGFGTSELDGPHAPMRAPLYRSPEQLVAEPRIDARSDVYSLGVIMYEAASGLHPYRCDSIPALVARISEGKVAPLDEARPGLPAAFVELTTRAMAKDRQHRVQTARELGDAIRALGAAGPIDPLGQTLPVSDPPAVSAALVAAIAAAEASRPAVPQPDSPSTTAAQRSDGRSRRRAFVVAAALVGAGIVAAVIATRMSDPRPGPEPAPSASPTRR